MGFKRAFKKLRKKLGVPALTLGNAAKAGAIAATGGVGGLAGAVTLSKLKSAAVGGIKQVARAKAAKALAKRAIAQAPKVIAQARATTMPGGAPLKRANVTRALKGAVVAEGKRVAKRARKAARKAAAPRSGKRQAPKGGKDFKALSAAWKAAGKPGKWIDWVKAH